MELKTSITAQRQTGPPALPVKQRRSQYSRSSSVDQESDGSVFSPLSPQHQGYSDVFPEPTDCHATKCPIHRRYDPSECHLERFFSEGTPPPVPKKRLARFMSLPYDAPLPSPLFPVSPLQLHRTPQNFDNPLYMLAPLPDHRAREEVKPVTSPLPLPSLSQLCFDTPDEQLSYLFSGFSDQTVVFQRIQHHQLLFLRSMAQNVHANILLQGESIERDVDSYLPQDFLLCEGYMPKQIGHGFYYRLRSPKFPGRLLGARVHKFSNSAHVAQTTPHVNLQEVIIHFTPDSVLKKKSAMLQTQAPLLTNTPSDPHCTDVKPSCGGSIASDLKNRNLPTVPSLLEMGYCVSVERDLPQLTLEDFIQETQSLRSSDPFMFERQLCVIFLQLIMGLHHLYSNGTAVELRAQNVFLLWPENKMEVPFEQEKDSTEKGTSIMETDQHESINKVKKGAQMLWRKSGTPRVVLAHQLSFISPPTTSLSINSQTGALLQYCLHTGENISSFTEASITNLTSSPYKKGLTDLACRLQDENSSLKMADTMAFLQILLWGPRGHLFTTYYTGLNTTINNWLAIKCALLVMKLAERGLIKDQSSVIDWEDCLYMQYLSFCDCETVMRTISNESNMATKAFHL